MVLPLGKYCVYYHRHQGVIFYVGSGATQRPYMFKQRGSHWRKFVHENELKEIEVEIVRWFDTSKEALAFERREIERLLPLGNTTFVPGRSGMSERPKHETTPASMATGAVVRRVRQEREMSIEDLAHQVEVNSSWLGELERGRQNVSVVVLDRLAKVLGVEAWELLRPDRA